MGITTRKQFYEKIHSKFIEWKLSVPKLCLRSRPRHVGSGEGEGGNEDKSRGHRRLVVSITRLWSSLVEGEDICPIVNQIWLLPFVHCLYFLYFYKHNSLTLVWYEPSSPVRWKILGYFLFQHMVTCSLRYGCIWREKSFPWPGLELRSLKMSFTTPLCYSAFL